jgi:hypothetical protein
MGSSQSLNAHIAKAEANPLWVWFTGATALLEGQAVCYDFDTGTAASYDAKRTNNVELPTQANARWFAGVAARNYAASSGGQFVEINAPGSTCNVMSQASTTIGVGRLTFTVGGTYAGYFKRQGFEGAGSCVPLQTVDRSTTAGKCLARLEVGPQSGGVEEVTAVAGANVLMVGGVSYIVGASVAADATFTLADGTLVGQRKGFAVVTTAVTTNNFVITVTSGVFGAWAAAAAEPTAALASITLNAIGEETVVEWGGLAASGAQWHVVYSIGSTLA